MSCGVGRRRGTDPELLWLWRRLAATALIRPLALGTSIRRGFGHKNNTKPKHPLKNKTKKKNRVCVCVCVCVCVFIDITSGGRVMSDFYLSSFFLNIFKNKHIVFIMRKI